MDRTTGSFLGILIVGSFLGLTGVESHGVISATATHDAWPTSEIFYRFNFTDDPTKKVVRDAMAAVRTGTGNCLKFTESTNLPQLLINLAPADMTAPALCTTNNGYVPNGLQMSKMTVFSGAATGNYAGACLDDQRDMMRLIMNAVGLYNEWRAAKRDGDMRFPPRFNDRVAPSLRSLDLFNDNKMFPPAMVTDVGLDTTNMDPNSITMISGERFAENPNKPVFTMAGGVEVGSLNRLSQSDCQTVQNTLYLNKCQTGFVDCGDPYADILPSFHPSSNINRPIQCQNPGKMVVTELLIADLIYAPALPAATRPSRAVIVGPTVPGLAVTFQTRRGAVIDTTVAVPAVPVAGASGCVVATDANCLYTVKFELTINAAATPDQIGGGVINRKVYINILPQTGTNVLATIPVTLTLNCAPVFRTLAATVGPHPAMTAELVLNYPDDIVPVPPPAAALQTNIVNALTKAILTARIVNYDITNGVGQTTPGAGPATQDDVVMKVFVNCNRDIATTTADAARLHIGGTSILGVVTAVDPEGDPVSYYAYSGDFRQLPVAAAVVTSQNAALTSTGELHTVTKDGVISISGIADLIADVTSAGLAANSARVAPTVERQVYIVAADPRGATSVLRARFFLACGIAVNA